MTLPELVDAGEALLRETVRLARDRRRAQCRHPDTTAF